MSGKNDQKVNLINRLRDPLRERFIVVSFLLSLFLNISTWILLYFSVQPRPDPIFLHYNIYYGIDLIGSWYEIYFIPGSGLIFLLANYILSVIMYPTKKLLAYLLVGFNLPLHLLLGLAAILIILINT